MEAPADKQLRFDFEALGGNREATGDGNPRDEFAGYLDARRKGCARNRQRMGKTADHSGGLTHGGQNGVAYEFWDLRDYGVSESLGSVHSEGNPIIHSTNCGSGRFPRTGRPSISSVRHPAPKFVPNVGFVYPLDALGVGNNPDAISTVGRTKHGRRNAVPPRTEPERGKVSENIDDPVTKQLCGVFHDDEAGSYLANKSSVFAPETRTRSGKALPPPHSADVLAGEAAADDIDPNSIGSKSSCREGANVVVAGDVRPVLSEDTTGELLDFAERDGLEAARALKAQRKAADAGKQIKDAELFHSASPQRVLGRHARLDQALGFFDGLLVGSLKQAIGHVLVAVARREQEVRFRGGIAAKVAAFARNVLDVVASAAHSAASRAYACETP